MTNNHKIAGKKRISDWVELKDLLEAEPNNTSHWETAFNDFLFERITKRYFEPIEAISKISESVGKGFSIIAIYCSLIEFFEALNKGYHFKNGEYLDSENNIIKSKYKVDKQKQPLPLRSQEIFIDFLTETSTFKNLFSAKIAKSFYENVRCSILHQAETQSNWLIKDGSTNSPIIIETQNNLILNWKSLKSAITTYLIEEYKSNLLTNETVKKNFIFKFNNISNTY